MQFNQVVVTAAPGDATTNSAVEIRALLRQMGPSDIFAHHIHPDLHGDVLPLGEFSRHNRGSRRPMDDVIIFHGSIGAPEVFAFVMGRPERLMLVYHNLSPADAFLPYSPEHAGLLETGRRDIARLAARVELALTPSHFNARELIAMGYRDVRVWPLIVDLDRVARTVADAATASELAELDGPLLLFVGQLVPHKRPEFLVQAFHILSTYLAPGARLAIAGAPRIEPYRRRLETFVAELNLPGLRMLGAVPDEVLAAYWQAATAYVTASEHEGFLQPVIEAMGLGVPVLARAFAAIPETVGGAGLVLPRDAGPAVFAEAMAEIITNEALRARLVGLGRQRRRAFDPNQARAAFLRHLLDAA